MTDNVKIQHRGHGEKSTEGTEKKRRSEIREQIEAYLLKTENE